jgi:hypothetical protein
LVSSMWHKNGGHYHHLIGIQPRMGTYKFHGQLYWLIRTLRCVILEKRDDSIFSVEIWINSGSRSTAHYSKKILSYVLLLVRRW